MTLTLLLDLDDTLLINKMDTFVPAYLKALAAHLAQSVNPELLIKELLRSTQIMLENDRPDRTLRETFDSVFYPALGIPREQLQDAIDLFYQTQFPALSPLTQPMPGAKELIVTAMQRQYDLILATNPLFPLLAILHRMDWAELSPYREYFQVIPSYETFHFAKPNPAYFAELLARGGWKEQPAIMVGDDLHNDIYPSRKAGLSAYWVTSDRIDQSSDCGELSRLITWIDQSKMDTLQPDFSTPQAVLAVLKSTPAALPGICSKLQGSEWNVRPQPTEWCQTEILCHLRDVEIEVNLPRVQKALQEVNPFIPGVESDNWAEQRAYQKQSGVQALQSFIQARIELIDILQQLQPQDWTRQIRHAIFGPTTLLELIGFMATHDRIHIRQIVQNSQQSRLL